MITDAIDLFAGPGGWDLAAKSLGLNVLGIEWDKAAVATRRAAGLDTIEGDVREYGANDWRWWSVQGLIASPPCQTFSMAGNGKGREVMDQVCAAVRSWNFGANLGDERTSLVLIPLRWILERQAVNQPYRWICLEQVPTVLPIWEAYADVLRELGYNVVTGIVSSEQYGVPQTRKRAILMAHLDAPMALPQPTHSAYNSYQPGQLQAGFQPWVSMQDALGWFSSSIVQRSNYSAGGSKGQTAAERGRGQRTVAQPSFALTSKGFQWELGEARRRVSVAEAGKLQSFPGDYPWQGNKGEQHQQVGNAIPVKLAEAVLVATLHLNVYPELKVAA